VDFINSLQILFHKKLFLHNELYSSTTISVTETVLPAITEPVTEEAPQDAPVGLNLSDVTEDPQPVASSVTVSLTPPPQIGLELFESEPATKEASQNAPDCLSLSDVTENQQPVVSSVTLTPTTPQIALELFESQLSSEQLQCYRFCHGKYDITTDNTYMEWKQLKLLCKSEPSEVLGATDSTDDINISNISLGDI